MKTYALGLLLFYSISSFSQLIPVIYNLPDANLPSNTICGKSRVCDPGPTRGIAYRFSDRPYSPDIDDASTPKSIAASVLGMAVSASKVDAEDTNYCSSNGYTSLFTINDVTPTGGFGMNGKNFKYNVKKKSTIDAKIAADANILELTEKNTINAEYLKELKAKLEIIYNRIKNSELEITANYSEWSLKKEVIEKVKNAPEYSECRNKLEKNNWAIITDIGLISYDIKLNGTIVSNLGTDLNAELKAKGINADLGVLIKKEVHKDLTSQIVKGYQIIGWRKLVIRYNGL